MALSLLAVCVALVLAALVIRSRRSRQRKTGFRYDVSEFPCGHARVSGPVRLTVLGSEVELVLLPHLPLCPSCASQYLNKYGTICATCGGPVLPGEPVGKAWVGAPHPHTHLTFDCCETGGLYCGRWGQGRLITLHEIDPEKYPADAGTAMSHAFKSGKVIIENDMK